VARLAGVSSSWVSQVERGTAANVSFGLLGVLLAIVGLDLSVRVYPGGSPLRDEGHRRLRGRFRALLPEGAPWRTEVPLPQPGDQWAWDAVTDLQALQRRIALKKRDGHVDRVVLVLADTRHNRSLLRLLGDSLRDPFPIQGRAARLALRSALDPGADLLVLV
jgi:transcriptional regulator with XRE-family HTH domain